MYEVFGCCLVGWDVVGDLIFEDGVDVVGDVE